MAKNIVLKNAFCAERVVVVAVSLPTDRDDSDTATTR